MSETSRLPSIEGATVYRAVGDEVGKWGRWHLCKSGEVVFERREGVFEFPAMVPAASLTAGRGTWEKVPR